MRPEENILFVAKLLELTRDLEELVIDYCRVLTANDDGHSLEEDDFDPVPF